MFYAGNTFILLKKYNPTTTVPTMPTPTPIISNAILKTNFN
jgi:hypothetical protein